MGQQTLSRFFPSKKSSDGTGAKDGREPKDDKGVKDGDKDGVNQPPVESGVEDDPAQNPTLNAFAYTKRNNDDVQPKQGPPVEVVCRKRKAALKEPEVGKRKILSKSKPEKSLTQFEQQILDFKLDHMDKILFIQSGYRYKFFGEDAVIASRILNIKLTPGKISFDLNRVSKDDHLYSTFAQASIPVERLLVHVRRFIVRGYKVGIIDQKETAAIHAESSSRSRVFERTLSHVYSPGTFIDDADLEKNVTGKSIICIADSMDNKISLVSVNVYVAEIVYDHFFDDFTRINLESRLHHLEPIEIITIGNISDATNTCIKNFKKFNDSSTSNITHIKHDRTGKPFDQLLNIARKEFENNDDVFSFFSNLNQNLLECFIELINYLKEFRLDNIFDFLENFKEFSKIDKTTVLDANVLRSLEIFNNSTTASHKGSLFEIIDYAQTKFGQRTLRNWLGRPLVDKESILERHTAVESLINKSSGIQIERVRNLLKNCPDLELMLSRIHYGRSNRKEVYLFMKKIVDIMNAFKNLHEELITLDALNSPLLVSLFQDLKNIAINDLLEFNDYLVMINSPSAMDTKSADHITEYFNQKFYSYLDIKIQNDEIEKINQLLELELEQLKIITKNRDLQFIKVNNEPFLIQIRKSNIKHVPKDWIRINATLNCVRYRSPETIKLYKKLQYQEDMLKKKCNQLFFDFCSKITSYYPHISKLIRHLASFDALLSLSTASVNNNYTKPKIVDIPTIQIKNSRNPISENLLKQKPSFISQTDSSSLQYSTPSSYIENDFTMQDTKENSARIALITGPNMGGKSSFMRQIGLIVILSQVGCFIPCDSNSILGIFENICIRLGSNDDIFTGKSTFQVELTECHNILQKCLGKGTKGGNSLVLMDELGRGTSTVDGCSIAWSVLDYLVNDMSDNVLVLFITHFKELEVFETLSRGTVKNYHLGYKLLQNEDQEELLFTYKLVSGYSPGSYGVYCAKIAGIPLEITSEADKISKVLESKAIEKKTLKFIDLINKKDIYALYNSIDLL